MTTHATRRLILFPHKAYFSSPVLPAWWLVTSYCLQEQINVPIILLNYSHIMKYLWKPNLLPRCTERKVLICHTHLKDFGFEMDILNVDGHLYTCSTPGKAERTSSSMKTVSQQHIVCIQKVIWRWRYLDADTGQQVWEVDESWSWLRWINLKQTTQILHL